MLHPKVVVLTKEGLGRSQSNPAMPTMNEFAMGTPSGTASPQAHVHGNRIFGDPRVKKYHPDSEYLMAAPSCQPWDKETRNQALLFIFVGFFYFTSLYVGMVEVLRDPSVHDYFPMVISKKVSDSLELLTTVILVLCLIYRGLHLGENASIHFKRYSPVYLMKGFIQTITIIPASDGVPQCRTRSLATMMLKGNCADMMFSGHTAATYLTCPRKYRFIIVP
jgi:hypothetical protein